MTTTTQMKNLLFTLFVLAGFSAFSQVSKPAFVSNSDLQEQEKNYNKEDV